ncbi:hypothetical protein [Chromobacterium phragmitis]|uniref:Uncharacterized protein n=1 Tax=Chromobacterium phragmitis TaxID=2202141 RepID=A0ABV0J2X2_9NEIS
MRLLSCDNPEDAIRSLAIVYQVDEGKVRHIASSGWPEWIKDGGESPSEIFKPEFFPLLMEEPLGAKFEGSPFFTAHYHRTRYDGSSEWFEDGLLPADRGTDRFLEKLRPYLDQETFEAVKSISTSNINERVEYEGNGGPHAFDTLYDAISAVRHGADYSVPEFLRGGQWDRYADLKTSVEGRIAECFIPVIVKFRRYQANTYGYVTNLWRYLYQTWTGEMPSGADCFPGTFIGGGKPVPREDFVELIDPQSQTILTAAVDNPVDGNKKPASGAGFVGDA